MVWLVVGGWWLAGGVVARRGGGLVLAGGRCRPGWLGWFVVGGGGPLGVVRRTLSAVALGSFGGAGSWGWPPSRRCSSPPGPGSLLGASHPLLPVHYVAVTALVGFAGSWSGAVGRLGVGVLGCWRGGPGSVRRGRVVAGGHRLVVARPLRGRGFCLVLRIRCCPSTTWPLLPSLASSDSWSGAVVPWRRGVRPLRRRSGLAGLGRRSCGVRVERRLGVLGQVCVRCLGFQRGARPFLPCRASVSAQGARNPHSPACAARAPGKAAGHGQSQAMGVASRSGFWTRREPWRAVERAWPRLSGPPPGQRPPTASRGMPTRAVTAT
ncbi:hypothetical protein ABIA38_008927 [Embleya sp. AB8]